MVISTGVFGKRKGFAPAQRVDAPRPAPASPVAARSVAAVAAVKPMRAPRTDATTRPMTTAEIAEDNHRRAVDTRRRDPLAMFLYDAFTRQVRSYGARALDAKAAGDNRRAVELAWACENAAANLKRVEDAINGNDETSHWQTSCKS